MLHAYEIRPRKDHRGVDLISDALPFGGLWYGEAGRESSFICGRLGLYGGGGNCGPAGAGILGRIVIADPSAFVGVFSAIWLTRGSRLPSRSRTACRPNPLFL